MSVSLKVTQILEFINNQTGWKLTVGSFFFCPPFFSFRGEEMAVGCSEERAEGMPCLFFLLQTTVYVFSIRCESEIKSLASPSRLIQV